MLRQHLLHQLHDCNALNFAPPLGVFQTFPQVTAARLFLFSNDSLRWGCHVIPERTNQELNIVEIPANQHANLLSNHPITGDLAQRKKGKEETSKELHNFTLTT